MSDGQPEWRPFALGLAHGRLLILQPRGFVPRSSDERHRRSRHEGVGKRVRRAMGVGLQLAEMPFTDRSKFSQHLGGDIESLQLLGVACHDRGIIS